MFGINTGTARRKWRCFRFNLEASPSLTNYFAVIVRGKGNALDDTAGCGDATVGHGSFLLSMAFNVSVGRSGRRRVHLKIIGLRRTRAANFAQIAPGYCERL